ncbi:ribonuclease R [Candidatus Puniceispirillum sp.]|nr:ribonuclease R [Candidatus Puniceispirillum sp.]
MAQHPVDDGPGNPSDVIGPLMPDEDALLDYINSCPAPPSFRMIAKAFKINLDQRTSLRRLLRDMADRGLLAGNQSAIAAPNTLPEVSVLELIAFDDNGDGMARLAGNDKENQSEIRVILSRRSGRAPAVGQQILARLARVGPALYEARIIRVLDRQQKRLFGVITAAGKGFRLQPAERGKRDSLGVQESNDVILTDGDLVEAELLPSRGYIGKKARILSNLGNVSSPGAFSALALAEFCIRHNFPDAAINESEGLKIPPVTNRRDLRNHPLVTIDGADAQDFDDAVFAEPADNDGWRLLVAIADVSHYVRPDTALDLEARKRGNSVYLPDRVVPMLPEAISNDLCSLRPGKDRAAMVAEIYIDKNGKRLSYKIERALIQSHARLTYDQVQAVFDGTMDEVDCNVPHGIVHALFGAWHALDKDRLTREPLALNLKERCVVMDDSNNAIAISQRSQTKSQRLIEDFMIEANVAAADMLIASRQPCVFRVHDTPDPKKAATLVKLAEALGGSFNIGKVLRPHHFNKILALAADTPDSLTVNEAVLRSQAKAIYSIENIGHFGLSLRNYAHFTSPIRRYADLLVHRALVDAAATSQKSSKDGLKGMPLDQIAEICSHISETESTAAAAERRTIDRFAAALFETKVGSVVDGIIASITGFGAFVRLEDGAADGLMPLKALPDDFYDYNEQTQTLEGRHNGWKFSVGTPLRVKVLEVKPVSGGILIEWVDGGTKNNRLSSKQLKNTSKHYKKSSESPSSLKDSSTRVRHPARKGTKQKRR